MHALLAYDNKHDDAASDSLNKLIGLESNQDEAYYYLAQIAKRKKQISAAENYLSHINEGDRFLTAQVELATLRIHDNRLITTSSAIQMSDNSLAFSIHRGCIQHHCRTCNIPISDEFTNELPSRVSDVQRR